MLLQINSTFRLGFSKKNALCEVEILSFYATIKVIYFSMPLDHRLCLTKLGIKPAK